MLWKGFWISLCKIVTINEVQFYQLPDKKYSDGALVRRRLQCKRKNVVCVFCISVESSG